MLVSYSVQGFSKGALFFSGMLWCKTSAKSFVQTIRTGVNIALCIGCFGKLLTKRSNGQLFRYLFCGERACRKTIHSKTAIYLGVRSILGVGASKLELLRKFNAVSLSEVQQRVG